MIAFLVGLLLVAVIVIGIVFSDYKKFKIENEEIKYKIRELEKTLRLRKYSFISYKGLPLKVDKICYTFNYETTKDTPIKFDVSTNTKGGRVLFEEFAKKPDTYFEILIGNEIRTFYACECSIGFLTLIEIIDMDKGKKEDETQNNRV